MWIAGLNGPQQAASSTSTRSSTATFPGPTIDMDFMNLNQSAHGDREFGFICTRLRLQPQGRRRPLAGRRGSGRAGRLDARRRRLARRAGARRSPASATTCARSPSPKATRSRPRSSFGYSVNGYGVGDLVARVRQSHRRRGRPACCAEYDSDATTLAKPLAKGGEQRESLREAARIELGMRAFLEDGGFKAFTTTFEDLHGLKQLPGLAVQRLMADGYGFGAEGDWKTAALVRAMKVMAAGLPGGDQLHGRLHLPPRPGRPEGPRRPHAGGLPLDRRRASRRWRSTRWHRRQGRPVPAGLQRRRPAPAVNASLVDMGNRFRMIVNEVDVVPPPDAAAQAAGRPRVCGPAAQTSRSAPPPGSSPAAPTTPASAWR